MDALIDALQALSGKEVKVATNHKLFEPWGKIGIMTPVLGKQIGLIIEDHKVYFNQENILCYRITENVISIKDNLMELKILKKY